MMTGRSRRAAGRLRRRSTPYREPTPRRQPSGRRAARAARRTAYATHRQDRHRALAARRRRRLRRLAAVARAAGRSPSASAPGERVPHRRAPRLPALPPLRQLLRRRRDARLRARARGARHPAPARRRQLVPRPRGGRDAAHRAQPRSSGPTTSWRSSRRCAARSSRSATRRCFAYRQRPPPPPSVPAFPDDLPDRLAPIGEALRAARALHRGRNHRPVADTIARLLEATRAHAGFALRPTGEQALANVLHVAELARAYESRGGMSFRGFVERLLDDAERGEAAEAPILEEGSDGVRIMTVHKAKGLEFPVVILADITAGLTGGASRYVDPDAPALRAAHRRLGAGRSSSEHEGERSGARRGRGAARRLRRRDARARSARRAGGRRRAVRRRLGQLAERRRLSSPTPRNARAWRRCPTFGTSSVVERPADRALSTPTACAPACTSSRRAATTSSGGTRTSSTSTCPPSSASDSDSCSPGTR